MWEMNRTVFDDNPTKKSEASLGYLMKEINTGK
jgi:hypothetical protein